MRLSIDIQGLKQMLWEKSNGTNLDELQPEEVAENAVRWIDTSCVVVDCLTKRMRPDLMIKLIDTGKLCLRATPESQLLKLRKQKLRAQKRQIVDNDCANENSFKVNRVVKGPDFRACFFFVCYFLSHCISVNGNLFLTFIVEIQMTSSLAAWCSWSWS